MQVFHSIDESLGFLSDGALCIGNFDGVHLGHQALIKKTCNLKGKAQAFALTFSPHIKEILCPKSPHFYLSNNAQKIAHFSKAGLDGAIFHKVSKEFLELSASDFIKELAVKLKIKHVIVGEDFTFGQRALGDTTLLKSLGSKLGFMTHVISKVAIDGVTCSSTTIRNYLKDGDIPSAKKLLGRDFSVFGTVISGQKQGRILGFPTANLKPENFFLKPSVYVSLTIFNGQKLPSLTNVGVRPTVSDRNEILVETHILHEEPDLYGQEIEVYFLERLRDEIKFPSLMALQEQLQLDRKLALKIHDHSK